MTVAELKEFDGKMVELRFIMRDASGIRTFKGKLVMSGVRVYVYENMTMILTARCLYPTEQLRFLTCKLVENEAI